LIKTAKKETKDFSQKPIVVLLAIKYFWSSTISSHF